MATKLYSLTHEEKRRLKDLHFSHLERNCFSISGNVKEKNGCYEWLRASSGIRCHQLLRQGKRYATVSVTVKGSSRFTVNAHVLSYFLHKETLPGSRKDCISHLCHNSKCVRPCHLSLEPMKVNIKRSVCKKARQCFGHNDYEACILSKANVSLDIIWEDVYIITYLYLTLVLILVTIVQMLCRMTWINQTDFGF